MHFTVDFYTHDVLVYDMTDGGAQKMENILLISMDTFVVFLSFLSGLVLCIIIISSVVRVLLIFSLQAGIRASSARKSM